MHSSYTYDQMDELWSQLEAHGESEGILHGRKYIRLGIENENGFRLSCCFPEKNFELLIELSPASIFDNYNFPDWKGMIFELVTLDVPVKNSTHLSLKLKNREYRDVFISLCADLAVDLTEIHEDKREASLAAFLDRWTNFFERFGFRGLSAERQRGLFGELYWLRILIDNGIPCITAFNAWKGCEKGYHDFELNGQVVEIKTTMSKEPRKVRINNERQLDDKGFISLHLLVLTLTKSDKGGESLPDLVQSLITKASAVVGGRRKFDQCLKLAGYLETQAYLYKDTYTVKKKELFKVEDGFPRITQLPAGLGDISYSLVVSSANNFLSSSDEYLAIIRKAIQ